MSGHGDHGEHAGRHGMAVVGKQTIYFSHMPTFDPPHDWQLLLEVSLSQEGGDPHQTYLDDREKHPDQALYSFDPIEFVIPDVLPHDGRPAAVSAIIGALVRDHFEKTSGEPLTDRDVVAEIVNIVHAMKMDLDAPPLEALEYVLFGKGDERFLAHRITRPPDFDHLLSVQAEGPFTDDDLAGGIPVRIAGRKNSIDERLEVDGPVTASADIGGKAVEVTLRPEAALFLDNEFLG